jgi:hypothetical protein
VLSSTDAETISISPSPSISAAKTEMASAALVDIFAALKDTCEKRREKDKEIKINEQRK